MYSIEYYIITIVTFVAGLICLFVIKARPIIIFTCLANYQSLASLVIPISMNVIHDHNSDARAILARFLELKQLAQP